jgi:hypothetical protein
LTPLPKRVKYRNIKEMAALLYAPAMGIACGAVAFFIFGSLWLFELLLIMPPIAFFGGCVWGAYLYRKTVRRSRIRQRVRVTCYRCKACDKIFNHEEPIE